MSIRLNFSGIGDADGEIHGLGAAMEKMEPRQALSASMVAACTAAIYQVIQHRGEGMTITDVLHAVISAALSTADSVAMTTIARVVKAGSLTVQEAQECFAGQGRDLVLGALQSRGPAQAAFGPLLEQCLTAYRATKGGAN